MLTHKVYESFPAEIPGLQTVDCNVVGRYEFTLKHADCINICVDR